MLPPPRRPISELPPSLSVSDRNPESFTEEEWNRYEMFRRSTFPKASIKRIMQSVSGAPVSQNVVIAMAGIAKVFVGELVEEALKVQNRYHECGPIEPKHIREAHRIVKSRNDRTLNLS